MALQRVLAFSRYANRVVTATPDLAADIEARRAAPWEWAPTHQALAAIDSIDVLAIELRRLRQQVFLHTMARDLGGEATLTEVCSAMTALAEVAIRSATALATRALAQTHGTPCAEGRQEPQDLLVVGMGKLGGGELNVSSDIDLVFAYGDEGETTGPRRVANREFFDRLGRQVIGVLNDTTEDGFVFRVDMRLRPYGESGPLTTSLAGLENYLVTQGRAWERYAWLKARAVTGLRRSELDDLVTPFVYRKYLDYDVYEGLRDIHRQIREQGARRDYASNVKLGDGGIREIEFIAQALQIVRGGREADLQLRGTLPALDALAGHGLLPGHAVAQLTEAYVFLRNVEHRLQYRDDRQTHQLPDSPEERALLADAMGSESLAAFDRDLARHRAFVALTFAQILGSDGSDAAAAMIDDIFTAAWVDRQWPPAQTEKLRAAGFHDPETLAKMLERVRTSSRYQQLPAGSRQRFDVLVPQLLAAAVAQPGLEGAHVVFERLLSLLETVARRSAYLALVIEHPPLLPRLASLMSASAWAADYLTRHPLLLDELLDAGALLTEPAWSGWRAELARQLTARPGDTEYQMDVLRHFQHAQTFRLLVQDLGGHLTVERLADHLSALADIVLEAALGACWTQLAGASAPPPRFAIVGYGKLGGKELGYASDLDLVFLFDIEAGHPDSDAQEKMYLRLGQRLNTWLTSTTAAGPLYDTDLRLRPDGAKGLLVTSLRSFQKYQRDDAWLWEHQALTRARYVAGHAQVGAAFEAERESILCSSRDPAVLADEVVGMRRKMHAGHPNPSQLFDLKHDPGGMVDIEFIVQYLVLAHAHDHASLTRNAGNIGLLALAGELSLIPAALAAGVADAYREFRRLQHQVRLTGAAHARVEPQPEAERRAAVQALWLQVFGSPWQDAPAQGPNNEIG